MQWYLITEKEYPLVAGPRKGLGSVRTVLTKSRQTVVVAQMWKGGCPWNL